LYDAESGKSFGEPLQGHTGHLDSVAFLPDGRRIVSDSADRTLQLWDATSGEPIGEPLQSHSNGVGSVAFSPDGRCIGSYVYTLRSWDSESGEVIGEPLLTCVVRQILARQEVICLGLL
jgi:WD40 repeat protein